MSPPLAAVEKKDAPLYDVDVEQLVLGAALIDNVILDQAAAQIVPDDFYDPLHRRMFATMLELRAKSSPVTPLTVKAALANDPGLAEVGKASYLNSIAISASGSVLADVAPYTSIIRDLAMRRDADIAMQDAREWLRQPNAEIFETLRPIVAIADRAAELSAESKSLSNSGLAAMAAVERAEGVRLHKRALGAPTGIRELDAVLGGLCAPDLIVLAGNSRMGKSALAGVMARASAEAGYQVEIFSLEMSAEQFSIRMACEIDYHTRGHDHPVSYSKVIRGKATETEIDRVMTASARLQSLPIHVHDKSGVTMGEIAAQARALAAKSSKPGVIIIDHLQIVEASDRYRGNRVQEVTEMTRQAKALAKRIGWCVVLLSQLNRDNSKRPDPRPTLPDLRESGSIEQDADIVLGAFRPAALIESQKPALREKDPAWTGWLTDYREARNKFEISVLKHRMGEQTRIACYCDMRASVICDNDKGGGSADETEDVSAGLLV